MKFKHFKKFSVIAAALILMSFAVLSFGRANAAAYTFKVHNVGKNTIVKLLASEDGQKYRMFDIGDGISAGETATIEWDKSTDEGDCEWLLKAAFDDNEESAPIKFDFCKKDLVIEIH